MELTFTEQGEWVLPTQGTLGNKAQNLLDNTPVIKKHGLLVPRSLVIPFEYLQAVDDRPQFVLEQVDRYFPGWELVIARSNAPDEDLKSRFPGIYKSQAFFNTTDRHPDADNIIQAESINEVLNSYNKHSARLRRERLGLEHLGMCLLLQELVEGTTHEGSFSDIGELALLTLTNSTKGSGGMSYEELMSYEEELRKEWVDSKGRIKGNWIHNLRGYVHLNLREEDRLARKLRNLTNALPYTKGKGWEIEFAGNKEGTYVVQTTPVGKREPICVPDNQATIFDTETVLGTGKVTTDGILYAPSNPSTDELVRFDVDHAGYCLLTEPDNLGKMGFKTRKGKGSHILEYLLNPLAILNLKKISEQESGARGEAYYQFGPHIETHMREGKVALAGEFQNELGDMLYAAIKTYSVKDEDQWVTPLLHSPTTLVLTANERSQRGSVAVVGKVHDFVPLSTLYTK